MYLDQVRAARSMNKHADVLTRKTREIDKSNQVREAKETKITTERGYTPLSAPRHPVIPPPLSLPCVFLRRCSTERYSHLSPCAQRREI